MPFDPQEYLRRYQKEHRKDFKTNSKRWLGKRKALLNEIKSSKGCRRCGNNDPRVLDFHHTDPENKKFTIGGLRSVAISKLQSELIKCEVLCANCHRIEESDRRR